MPKLASGLLVSLPSGKQEYGPLPIPDQLDRITVRLKRCTTVDPLKWPNQSTKVDMRVNVSYDGGATYEFVAGAGAAPPGRATRWRIYIHVDRPARR